MTGEHDRRRVFHDVTFGLPDLIGHREIRWQRGDERAERGIVPAARLDRFGNRGRHVSSLKYTYLICVLCSMKGRLLFVVFTARGQRTHLISARTAEKDEEEIYEQGSY
jgi:hypothetical protein